jgi:hypothetical protein
MPKGHDHAKWAENKKERDAKFAEKRGQRDKAGGNNMREAMTPMPMTMSKSLLFPSI